MEISVCINSKGVRERGGMGGGGGGSLGKIVIKKCELSFITENTHALSGVGHF